MSQWDSELGLSTSTDCLIGKWYLMNRWYYGYYVVIASFIMAHTLNIIDYLHICGDVIGGRVTIRNWLSRKKFLIKLRGHSKSFTIQIWTLYFSNMWNFDKRNSVVKNSIMEKLKMIPTWTRRILCIGVKWRRASACKPTWSSVERVLVSQMFLAGHHNAWSDQSFGNAANEMKEKILKFCNLLRSRLIYLEQTIDSPHIMYV
jgi:hypothetical protein